MEVRARICAGPRSSALAAIKNSACASGLPSVTKSVISQRGSAAVVDRAGAPAGRRGRRAGGVAPHNTDRAPPAPRDSARSTAAAALSSVAKRVEFRRGFGNLARRLALRPEIAQKIVGEHGAEAVRDDDDALVVVPLVQRIHEFEAALADRLTGGDIVGVGPGVTHDASEGGGGGFVQPPAERERDERQEPMPIGEPRRSDLAPSICRQDRKSCDRDDRQRCDPQHDPRRSHVGRHPADRPQEQPANPAGEFLPGRAGGEVSPVELVKIRAYAMGKRGAGNALARGDLAQLAAIRCGGQACSRLGSDAAACSR